MNGNEPTITIFEIAALLGALAWLPHIIGMIKKYFVRPEIRIIIPKYGELGFTILGNILNFKIAFSVKHKDAVISGIRLKIVHESGDEKILSWQGIVQRYFVLKREDGSYPMEREQDVLAIKLNLKEIDERIIRFQEEEYLLNKNDYENKLLKKSVNLKKNNLFLSENVLKLDEYQDLLTFVKQSFNWKSGFYTITFLLESPEKITVLDNTYTFELTTLDLESLEKNKEFIADYYGGIIKDYTKVEPDSKSKKNTEDDNNDIKYKEIPWVWLNPLIKKSS